MLKNNWDIVSQNFPPEKVTELKRLFALLMAKYDEDTELVLNDTKFRLAMQNHIGCLLYAINNWTFDVEVKNLINYFKTDGVSEILPSKVQIAQEFLAISRKAIGVRDRILALQEYSKLMGYDKDEDFNKNTTTQNVILLADNGSNLNWEEKLRTNQFELQDKADKILGLDDEVKH